MMIEQYLFKEYKKKAILVSIFMFISKNGLNLNHNKLIKLIIKIFLFFISTSLIFPSSQKIDFSLVL
jgi:hypothetical protein